MVRTSLLCEAVLAAVIVPRLWLSHGMSPLEVLYSGAFHSIMAFNNAGLSLYDDSLTRFSGDPVILLPIAAATIVGGLGFPVLLELRRHLRSPRRWSLHTKLTMTTTGLLFAAGIVLVPSWSGPTPPPWAASAPRRGWSTGSSTGSCRAAAGSTRWTWAPWRSPRCWSRSC